MSILRAAPRSFAPLRLVIGGLVVLASLFACDETGGEDTAPRDAARPSPADASMPADAATPVDAGRDAEAPLPTCPDGDTPSIGVVTGSVGHGATLEIQGCRFGDEPTAPALVWDDFENGSAGDLVGHGWTPQRSGETHPIYTDRESYGQGRLALTNHVEPNVNEAPGCQFCGAYRTVEPSNELYVSYRFRFDVTGNDYGVLKLARLASSPNYGGVDYYNGTGTLTYQYQPHAGWGYANLTSDPDTTLQVTIGAVPRGEWHRVEMYYRLSSPAGAPNGAAYVAIDGEHDPAFAIEDEVTLGSDHPTQLHSLLLPLMLANPRDDGKFDLYVDDVYLDDTRARVEIGDAPRWGETVHREIQPASSWSGTSITATVHQGRFADCDTAYVYVVDHDGAVNEDGYPVTIGAGDCGD